MPYFKPECNSPFRTNSHYGQIGTPGEGTRPTLNNAKLFNRRVTPGVAAYPGFDPMLLVDTKGRIG